MFEIEDNIPLLQPKDYNIEWPFKDMEVGQHVKIHDFGLWPKALRAAHALGKKRGWKFRGVKNKTFGFIQRVQ